MILHRRCTRTWLCRSRGGSFLAFLGGCLKHVRWNYEEWQGSFGAIFFGTLNPISVDESLYVLTGFVTIGLLTAALFAFWRSLAGKDRIALKYADMIACVCCIMIIELMPRAVDLFYWWDGSANYLPFYVLLLFWMALLVRMVGEERTSVPTRVMLCLVSFVSMSGNYVTALENMLVMLLAGLLIWYLKAGNRRVWFSYALSMAAAITGLLISVLAPGNTKRMTDEGAIGITSIPKLILKCISLAGDGVRDDLTIMMLLLLMLLIPAAWKMGLLLSKRMEERGWRSVFDIPVPVVVMVLFALYTATFAPSVYVYGDGGVMRVVDIRFCYLVLYLAILVCFLSGKTAVLYRERVQRGVGEAENKENTEAPEGEKGVESLGITTAECKETADETENAERTCYERENEPAEKKAGICIFTRFLVADLVMIIIFGFAYYMLPREHREVLTSICAARSIAIGEAARYDAEMEERLAILKDASTTGQDVVLPVLTAHPQCLYAAGIDISDRTDGQNNVFLAIYYDKASVGLEVQEENP